MASIGSKRLWSFGLFPVIAAAAFQVAIVFRARDDLAEFFFAQSIIAIGISLASLQPRTWQASLRTTARLRTSFILTSIFVVLTGIVIIFTVTSSLRALLVVFVLKKLCDSAREFFFLDERPLKRQWAKLSTALESLGVGLLFMGWTIAASIVYGSSALILGWMVFHVSRADPATSLRWVLIEAPMAIVMTLFNMGSRLILVFTSDPRAHLEIGSLLQVSNFCSPVFFAIFSRQRRANVELLTMIGTSLIVFGGTVALVFIGGGSLSTIGWLLIYSVLTSVNRSLVIKFMNFADGSARRKLGMLITPWVLLGSVIAALDIVYWPISYTVFLLGNSALVFLLLRRGNA